MGGVRGEILRLFSRDGFDQFGLDDRILIRLAHVLFDQFHNHHGVLGLQNAAHLVDFHVQNSLGDGLVQRRDIDEARVALLALRHHVFGVFRDEFREFLAFLQLVQRFGQLRLLGGILVRLVGFQIDGNLVHANLLLFEFSLAGFVFGLLFGFGDFETAFESRGLEGDDLRAAQFFLEERHDVVAEELLVFGVFGHHGLFVQLLVLKLLLERPHQIPDAFQTGHFVLERGDFFVEIGQRLLAGQFVGDFRLDFVIDGGGHFAGLLFRQNGHVESADRGDFLRHGADLIQRADGAGEGADMAGHAGDFVAAGEETSRNNFGTSRFGKFREFGDGFFGLLAGGFFRDFGGEIRDGLAGGLAGLAAADLLADGFLHIFIFLVFVKMGLALLEHVLQFFFLRLDLRLQIGVRQDIFNRDARHDGLLLVVQRQFALAGFEEFRDFVIGRGGVLRDVHREVVLADRVLFKIFVDFVVRHFDAFGGLFFQTVDDQILLDDFVEVAAAHAVRNHVVVDEIKIALLGEILLAAENRLRLDRVQKLCVRHFVQAQFMGLVEGAHALKRQLQQL